MAESQAGASSSVDRKKKSSDLDGDFGKEFLSSWKSMSVTDNDGMDFDFETVPKGNKKTFKFDKLDMDFNLDGDFGKISSFKLDMSDLDFSSPAKSNAKNKEGSKEESTNGNRRGKQDQFSFSFDFNGLDDFNFGSKLMEGDKKSSKSVCSQKIVADTSDSEGSRIQEDGDAVAVVNKISTDVQASDSVTTSKIDTSVGDPGDHDYMTDSPLAKSLPVGDLVMSKEMRMSPKKTPSPRTNVSDKRSHSSEITNFTEPCIQHVIQDLPTQSIAGNNVLLVPASELQTNVSSSDKVTNASLGGDQNVIPENIVSSQFNHENSRINSPLHDTGSLDNRNESRKQGSNSNMQEKINDTELAVQSVSDLHDGSAASASRKMLNDTHGICETKKLPLPPYSSGFTVDRMTVANEKEAGTIWLKYFRKSDESKQLRQTLSTQTKITSSDNKSIGTVHSVLKDDRSEGSIARDTQSGGNMADDIGLLSGGPTKVEPCLIDSAKTLTNINSIRKSSKYVQTQPWSKPVGNARHIEEKVAIGHSVSPGSGKNNDTNRSVIGNQVNPSSSVEKTSKYGIQKDVTLKRDILTVDSAQSTKIISLEKNKLSSIKASGGTPDLSLQISRSTGEKSNLSNSTRQKEIKSLKNLQQDINVHENAGSKTAHPGGTEKQIPVNPCLKRKSYEASNTDLVNSSPLKRLSESPRATRDREFLEKALHKQACNQQNLADINMRTTSSDQSTTTFCITPEMNMAEPEISLLMEDDGNVEKAEAYAKDLEEICNMLKKKHEEVKELLVRAIVNNNNLLMLNHPVYEDKIRTVQKFAGQLMSKELQA